MIELNVLNAIKKELKKSNIEFFEYAWREKLTELSDFLEEESKYAKLVEWINKRIDFFNDTKNVFSPADKNEKTSVSMVNTYMELMKNIAVLIHCREILLDKQSTNKMRDNIEYTLCKIFKIHYNKELGEYI